MTMTELFGDVIYSYTRKQSIEDGFTVDLSESDIVKESGFKYPVYMTRRVWDVCVEVPENQPTQDLNGRLWDVLSVMKMSIRNSRGDRLNFTVSVLTEEGRRNQHLVGVCGPVDIDDPSPSITIMYPDED